MANNISPINSSHPTISRRRFLQVGGLAAINSLLPSYINPLNAQTTTGVQAAQSTPIIAPIREGRDPGKSLILIVLQGGASHFDTFDPRHPGVDSTIRGPFNRVPTNVPGVFLTEPFQRLPRMMDKVLLVRNLFHNQTGHPEATGVMFTGSPERTGFDFYADAKDPSPFIEFNRYLSRLGSGDVGYVLMHHSERADNIDIFERPLSGLHSRSTETMYIPYNTTRSEYPNPFGQGLNRERYRERYNLLQAFESSMDNIPSPVVDRFLRVRELAHSRLDGPLRNSFNLDSEDPRVRDRYGRNPFGEALLIARRMVQNGARVVVVNDGHYDHHYNIDRHLSRLIPMLDQGLSALIQEQEMLDLPLVAGVVSEFGRTPRINNDTDRGREHWPYSNSMLLAGDGINGGNVVGETNNDGSIRGNALDARLLGETLLNKIGFARYLRAANLNIRTQERLPSLPL